MLRRTTWTRAVPLALALVAISPLQACFGKFGLTKALYDWNKNASSDFVVQELLFLAFIILPVYQVAMLADGLILNTIEFFTGEHPIGGADANLERVEDGFVLQHLEDGVLRTYRIYEGQNGLELVDDTGRTLAATHRLSDGTFEVVGQDGRVLNRPGKALLASIGGALTAGDSQLAVMLAGSDVNADACLPAF